MLMFDNGILATFIPEILMVLGFLFCLIVPNVNSTNSTIDINSQIVHINAAEQVRDNKTYITTSFDFQQVIIAEIAEKQTIVYPAIVSDTECSEHIFKISKVLSFIQFSRPPPFVLS